MKYIFIQVKKQHNVFFLGMSLAALIFYPSILSFIAVAIWSFVIYHHRVEK